MNVAIAACVREAGLKDASRKAAELFLKMIPETFHNRTRLSFEILADARGGRWVLVTLEYDGRVTERDVFSPSALSNHDFVCKRFEWLWERALRTRLIQQSSEPTEEVTKLSIPDDKGK